MTLARHGWVIWLTGIPGAGKTTLAQELVRQLHAHDISATVLDADAIRDTLIPHSTYRAAEHDRFYTQLVASATLLARAGANVVIAATAHRQEYRSSARMQLAPFAEVWVRCPPAICQTRDPQQLYAAYSAGTISSIPGIDLPYEPSEHPEVIVDTDQQTPEEAAAFVLAHLAFIQPTSSTDEVHVTSEVRILR